MTQSASDDFSFRRWQWARDDGSLLAKQLVVAELSDETENLSFIGKLATASPGGRMLTDELWLVDDDDGSEADLAESSDDFSVTARRELKYRDENLGMRALLERPDELRVRR